MGDELDYDTKVASCSKCYPMFNERLIELQQEFAKEFLTHVNPYTGLALVDEPAVITVQINNEESAIKGLWIMTGIRQCNHTVMKCNGNGIISFCLNMIQETD